MLLRASVLKGIANGTITLAFRRWEAPRVRAGGRQRTAVGVVAFDAVEVVAPESITDDDAHAAGFDGRTALLAVLDRRDRGAIHRVQLRLDGPDPRVALRDAVPSARELADICRRLDRLDRASHHGPWTGAVMRRIDEAPSTRAAELAAGFGRETAAFKLDVRKLKELGLTESLRPGYRLSPRGRAVLAHRPSRANAPSERPSLTLRAGRRYHAADSH
jgi:hypothetical protein